MIQLAAILLVCTIFFAFIGYSRGWNKEIIAMAGIILMLFALHEFDDFVRGVLLANLPRDQVFALQALLFLVVVYFAYQTRAIIGNDAKDGRRGGADSRDPLQEKVLGSIVGALNGYMIFGSIWYFMDINAYPLSPFVSAPAAGTTSADLVQALPLYVLAGGPAGNGNLLALCVILLFIAVLVLI